MPNHLDYFKEVNAQKQIDKLAKKYAGKNIVIYGAGIYFQILKNNFDLSKLNIVALADKKFENSEDYKNNNFMGYKTITPEELKEFDFDVILVALYDDTSLCNYLEYDLLINTKNEGKNVLSIIEPTIRYFIKTLVFS